MCGILGLHDRARLEQQIIIRYDYSSGNFIIGVIVADKSSSVEVSIGNAVSDGNRGCISVFDKASRHGGTKHVHVQ